MCKVLAKLIPGVCSGYGSLANSVQFSNNEFVQHRYHHIAGFLLFMYFKIYILFGKIKVVAVAVVVVVVVAVVVVADLVVVVIVVVVVFSARQHMLSTLYAIDRPSVRLSVCLSVRLSYRWISRKRLNLGSCNSQLSVQFSSVQ